MTNPEPATVRPATAADRAGWERLFDLYLAFYETSRDAALKDLAWVRILNPESPMHALVAEAENGRIIGIANYLFHPTFWEDRDVCYLNDLFVEPDRRGGGIARRLIEAVAADAAAKGAPEFYWQTAEDNHRARALYDRIAAKTPFVQYILATT